MINDNFINKQELELELKNMQSNAEILNGKLSLLSQQVAYIFLKIESCETLQSAEDYFDVLDSIQGSLACLFCKYNIGVSDRLLRFVRDFDNLGPLCREYCFEKIRSGEYSF